MVRELMLMRHAKSDRAHWDGLDHERPLNARGVDSARAVGKYLEASGRRPDGIISSTAVRARTTADLVVEAAGWDIDVVLDERLYGSGPMQLLNAIRETSDDRQRMLVVGHQPTWSMAASGLAPDAGAIDMPTAAVAVLTFDSSWSDLGWAKAKLVDHVLARPLLGE
jgi:phosphohistidine phosphatase